MSDISLNAGIRSNLLQLQQSSRLFDRTVGRLASGRAVNTAIDNPTNFFASVNLNDRADGLNARLDAMGQAVQRIKSADNGISTIRGFVSAMKGVVNNALGNTDADARNALGRQFNELVVQISEVAKDSGYAGINLLERNETEVVQFNETFDASVLNVRGFDLVGPDADGRGRVDANGNIAAASNITNAVIGGAANAVASQAAITASVATAAGATVTTAGATGVVTSAAGVSTFSGVGTDPSSSVSFASASATSAGATVTAAGATVTVSQATQASRAAQASGTFLGQAALVLQDQDGNVAGIRGANAAGGAGQVNWGSDVYKTELAGVITELERFDEALKSQASDLAQNLATITTREDFTNNLINTLTEGADKLTLADLNEEGANLLALQTSSQLATQSLSLASQQSQQVLQLLG